jgi:hypothetical protein
MLSFKATMNCVTKSAKKLRDRRPRAASPGMAVPLGGEGRVLASVVGILQNFHKIVAA